MESFKSAILCIALAGLTIVACEKDDSMSSLNNELDRTSQISNEQERSPWVEKVSGSGHVDICFNPDSCFQRTFTVHATKDANGNVSGSWTRISRHFGSPSETHSRGYVECFNIVGNRAWVGVVGDQGAFQGDGGFQLYDGGNPGAGNDSLSNTYAQQDPGFAQFYCDVLFPGPVLRPLESGNIKIQTR